MLEPHQSKFGAASGRLERGVHFARSMTAWWRGNAVLWVLLVLAIAACVSLAEAAHNIPYFAIDLAITRALQEHRGPTLDTLFEWASWPGFPPQSNVMFVSIFLLLVASGRFLAAAGEVLAAGGSAALWYAIAPLVDRPGPHRTSCTSACRSRPGAFRAATC